MTTDERLAEVMEALHEAADSLAADLSDSVIEIGNHNHKDAKALIAHAEAVTARIQAMRESRRPVDLIDAALFRIRT